MAQRHVRTLLGTLALFLAAMHTVRLGTAERVEAAGLGVAEPQRAEMTGAVRIGLPVRKSADPAEQESGTSLLVTSAPPVTTGAVTAVTDGSPPEAVPGLAAAHTWLAVQSDVAGGLFGARSIVVAPRKLVAYGFCHTGTDARLLTLVPRTFTLRSQHTVQAVSRLGSPARFTVLSVPLPGTLPACSGSEYRLALTRMALGRLQARGP